MTFVVDPTAVPAGELRELSRRPESLSGLPVGVLVNGKEYSEAVLRRIVEQLAGEHDFGEIVWWDKHFPAQPAPRELVDQMVSRCAVAITGVGHCGASTTRSVLDCITLEERGLASVVVLSSTFAPVGRAIAQRRGFGQLAVATVPHPVGDPDLAVVRAKADQAVSAVRAGLVVSLAAA